MNAYIICHDGQLKVYHPTMKRGCEITRQFAHDSAIALEQGGVSVVMDNATNDAINTTQNLLDTAMDFNLQQYEH